MTKRLTISDKDKVNINSSSAPSKLIFNDCAEYEGFIIKKPWGFEYLFFHNQHVAGWVLHIKQDRQTSLHCHPNKKTSLVVLKGEGIFSTYNGSYAIKEGESVIMDKGVFHSTKATSQGEMIVLEMETPPSKKDLYRFDDVYGREFSAYEGKEFYVSIGQGEYANIPTLYNFHDNFGVQKKVGNYSLSIHKYGHIKQLDSSDHDLDNVIAGVLGGGTLVLQEKNTIESGDLVHMRELREASSDNFSDDNEIIIIKRIN